MALSHDLHVRIKAELLAPGGPNTNPSDQWTDDQFSLMDKLEGFNLADCILQATIRGQERLVRTLMERRGPVPIVFGCDPRVPGAYTLNGECFGVRVEEHTFASNIKSPAALKSLLAMVVEFGMKGFIEPGESFPILMKRVETNSFLLKNNVSRFDGVMPELVDGLLGQPELAIALNHESARTSTPDAYQSMLCWASKDMVEQFPKDLAPLVPYQRVDGNSMGQWKSASGQPRNMDFTNIVVGVTPSKVCSNAVEYLHQTMSPRSSKYGFPDDRGRVLCETTADFLLQFPASDCSDENLKAAFDFTANYCPIDIMAAQAAVTCREKFGVVEIRHSFNSSFATHMNHNFDFLFEALKSDDPLHERVMGLMTKDQWSGLLGKATSVNPPSMVGLYQAFKLDNAGRSSKAFPHHFEILAQGGFKYAQNTKVFEDDRKFDEHNRNKDLNLEPSVIFPFSRKSISALGAVESVKETYRNCAKVNLWPDTSAAPLDVGHALQISARLSFKVMSTSKILALHSYFLNAGVEECAKAATKPSHWMTLTEIFSGDELQPYLKEMPGKARGRVLESGLGL
mgnify:FL=1